MEILYLLIPIAIVLVIVIVIVLIWAISHDQFDDLDRHGNDILMDDDKNPPK